IFNSGSNVGALLTPLAVPWITLHWGWQWAFVLTGLTGFVWLGFWLRSYHPPETHPRLGEAERAYIHSDPPEQVTPIRWAALVGHRQTWAFAIGKFVTDPIWWMYLFWIPDFLHKNHGLDLKSIGLPLVVIYLVADGGAIGGGRVLASLNTRGVSVSSPLSRRGCSVNAARKTAMLVCALLVVPIVCPARTSSLWTAVALVSIAAAAHQGWSANIFTLVSDMFPRRAVGSVVGLGGMAGAVGGMLISIVVGEGLHRTHSLLTIFIVRAFSYLGALVII